MGFSRRALLLALVAAPLVVWAAPAAAELSVGDRAPQFSLPGSDGRTYALADLLSQGGNRGIVLAFFPKAFTPG
jgi:peroxiredoxin Q/BCP